MKYKGKEMRSRIGMSGNHNHEAPLEHEKMTTTFNEHTEFREVRIMINRS